MVTPTPRSSRRTARGITACCWRLAVTAVEGNWSHAGIHVENNDLRLGAGARVVFEGSAEGGDEFALAFNPESRQLEISRAPTGKVLWTSGSGN